MKISHSSVKKYLSSAWVALLLTGGVLISCTSSLKKENEALRQEINDRREALAKHQDAGLKQAQQELALTDSLLTQATSEYDSLYAWMMANSLQLSDHSPQVEQLTLLRARCDSLKIQFEVLCEKIKYIRKKQREQEE